jgi:hypothetical protein
MWCVCVLWSHDTDSGVSCSLFCCEKIPKSKMKKDPFEHHFQTKVEEGVHKSLIIILEKLLFACL